MPWADYIEAMRDGVRRHGPVRAGVYAMTTGDGREGGRRMSLVFAGVCSHAPGITGRAHLADPALRDPFHAALRAARRASSRATRPDALVVVGAEHFANFFMNNMPAYAIGMADHYEGPIEDPALARHRAHAHSRQRRPLAPADRRRGDADGRRRLRRGVEVRPRHHGAAALPDAALRPARDSGQHQLPGPAADAAAPRLGLRRGAAARRRRACPSGSRSSARAASRIGRRRPTRARSTKPGTASSWRAGRATTARRCSPTPTPRPIATPARAASRSARSSPSPPRRAARGECAIYAADPDLLGRLHGRHHVDRDGRLMPHLVDPLHRQPGIPSRHDGALCRRRSPTPCWRSATRPARRSSRPAAFASSPIRRTHSRSPTASATTRSSTSTCAWAADAARLVKKRPATRCSRPRAAHFGRDVREPRHLGLTLQIDEGGRGVRRQAQHHPSPVRAKS